MIDVLVYFGVILLCVYPFAFIYYKEKCKKELQKKLDEVDNKCNNLFRTMTLKEWDKFIKEENDPYIKTYNVFTKVNGIQKFDYYDLVNFLREHKDHINWLDLLHYVDVPVKILEEFTTYFTDDFISTCVFHQKLPEDFINRYKEELGISYILRHQKVSEKFIEENKDVFTKQDWIFVAGYQKLSEAFILKYKKKLNGKIIILRQNHLSREFILNLYKKINWVEISMERLDEDFMRKWKDKLYWTYICSDNNKNMSDDFIMEMKDYVEWRDLWLSRVMSKRIKEEAKKQLGDWIYGS